jgi:hypothetical protein
MSAWAQLLEAFLAETAASFAAVAKEHKIELNKVVSSSLFDEPGPKNLERVPTPEELFLHRMFDDFSEIHASAEALSDIEVYISRFPFARTRVDKHDYLKHQIQSYFQEIYILRERLKVFLTRLGREFRGDDRHSSILKATKPLFAVITDSLKGVVDIRGTHVHARRFTNEELGRLGMLKLLAMPIKGKSERMVKAIRPYFELEYRRIRKKWKRQLSENNKVIRQLLDIYAERVNQVFLDSADKKKIVYPSSLKQPNTSLERTRER